MVAEDPSLHCVIAASEQKPREELKRNGKRGRRKMKENKKKRQDRIRQILG